MAVSITVEGDEVVIRFPLTGDDGLSSSKKTRIDMTIARAAARDPDLA